MVDECVSLVVSLLNSGKRSGLRSQLAPVVSLNKSHFHPIVLVNSLEAMVLS